jgi:hypothetical protein
VPFEWIFCTVQSILGTSDLVTNGTTIHRPLSVQLLFHQRLSRPSLPLYNMWCTNTKAALATCKDIFPPGAANTDGSERAGRSPECSPSCPKRNLEASRKPRGYGTRLFCGRMLKCVGGLTYLAVLTLDFLFQVSSDYEFMLWSFSTCTSLVIQLLLSLHFLRPNILLRTLSQSPSFIKRNR